MRFEELFDTINNSKIINFTSEKRLCNQILCCFLLGASSIQMHFSFWNDALNESVSFHQINHSCLCLRVIKLFPSFFKFLSFIQERLGLNECLLLILGILIDSFPFFYDITCKFTCVLFTQHIFVEWLTIFTPALLRIIRKFE